MSDRRYEGYRTDQGLYACVWENGQCRPLKLTHALVGRSPAGESCGYYPSQTRLLAIAMIYDMTGFDFAVLDHARELADWLEQEVLQAHWSVSQERVSGWLLAHGYPTGLVLDGVDLSDPAHTTDPGPEDGTNGKGGKR